MANESTLLIASEWNTLDDSLERLGDRGGCKEDRGLRGGEDGGGSRTESLRKTAVSSDRCGSIRVRCTM